jgi:hypothetical protein
MDNDKANEKTKKGSELSKRLHGQIHIYEKMLKGTKPIQRQIL